MPTSIGRYQIEGELGRGSMGVVYRAHDPLLHRTIALKTILTPEGLPDELVREFEERFFAEGRAAARLSHPAIVVVHDIGRDPTTGVLFMALEHLQGETLAQQTAGGRAVPWSDAVSLAATVAEALHHASVMGVVHRDVKPANIMVLLNGEPKIMDFGIAKIETTRLRLTGRGETFGTPLYMSPEQALGAEADHRGDIFSLGATLYRALTGTDAFAAQSMAAIIQRVVQDDPAPPSSLNPVLPASLDVVLARALAKAPETRYPDAKAMAEDLQDVRNARPPRHASSATRAKAPGEEVADLDLWAELVPVPSPAVRPVDSAARADPTRRAAAAPVVESPSTARSRIPHGVRWLIPAAFLGLVAWLGWLRGPSTPTITNTPSPTATAPSPVAAARTRVAPSPPRVRRESPAGDAVDPPPMPAGATTPATLAIDFEHGLKSGTLRVWVDDDLVLDEALDSRVTKKVLVLKSRKGGLEQELKVSPGRHGIRVQVLWDDSVKTRTIQGTFRPGSTRRLSARLGGLIRRDLSLDWE